MSNAIIVTGAGSGIGLSIAKKLAALSENYRLILVGRNQEKLEKTKELLKRSSDHFVVAVDIADKAALVRSFQDLDLESLGLYSIVANAGMGGPNSWGGSDNWQKIIDTNLTGTYNVVGAALSALRKSDTEYKHIVIIASILARLGVPGYSAYCASKAGLMGLMRSWASEYAREKILVNTICPGWVNTDMAREGIEAFAAAMKISYEDALRMQMQQVPLGKMSEPEEIADMVDYLISIKQTSITGQNIDVNNGALMP